MSDRETLEGYVDHMIFRNEENGYTVFRLVSSGSRITCTGSFGDISSGESIAVTGAYTEHPVYGRQFRVDSYEMRMPEETAAIERYLASGAVKGIKAALAARIVKKFGTDTLRVMEEEPERLTEIRGISERKAREIASQMSEKADLRNAMLFLGQYGISVSLATRLYGHYGEKIYQVIRENPYRMAGEVTGVGFKIADDIASKAGIQADDGYRIRSGILYTLSVASRQGHVFLPSDQLTVRTAGLLGLDTNEIGMYITDLAAERKVVLRALPTGDGRGQGLEEPQTAVYSAAVYHLELDTARMLCELDEHTEQPVEQMAAKIAAIEEQQGYCLTEEQKKAVSAATAGGVLVLTGGPGTGKTTTINAMIRYFLSENLQIRLAAPTGRAAKRMTEATGYEAQTIHRMLEFSGMEDMDADQASLFFERNEDNPLEADVIIIDEMSMVDIYLMHALLSALMPGTRLILVGDVNQLPSVGPGSVLKDIIHSGVFHVIELNRIFRQAAKSDIVVNAHRINAGQDVALDNYSEDFFFLKRYDADTIIRVMIALIQEKLPRYVNARPADIQVLTPMRKGLLGVERLNEILQRYLNPPSPRKMEKETAGGLFREGDKVMQIRNNYHLEWEIRGKQGIQVQKGVGIFNGDIGIVREIDSFSEILTVEFDEGRMVDYTFRQLEELELAYAVTVHKSQGSEYPAVILPLLAGPKMLMNRNLLYTAVTRARKCVTVVGSDRTFREMIRNESEQRRYSSLDMRILEMHEIREKDWDV